MESEVCQDLFSKADYKVMITDEDGTSEAKVKSNVNADIEKWSDKNHVVRIFSIALSKHKGDAKGMQDAIFLLFHMHLEITVGAEHGVDSKKTQKRTSTSISLVEKISLEMASGLFWRKQQQSLQQAST